MHHDLEALMATVVIAITLGIIAQVLAFRFKLPAILPLLIFGMAAGPYGVGVFDPKLLGHGLEVVVHLGVAVILFEGGLSVDLKQLRQVGSSIRNLLTLGTAITAVGAAFVAHYCVDISWSTAALFGAIVTVTGPTVIAPLLRHMIAPRKVRTILLTEGLLIDAIGAVLAYLVLQWIERTGAGIGIRPLFFELVELIVTGSVVGFAAGSLAVFVVRMRHMSSELTNLVILTTLWASFAICEHQAPQSGILAAVVMGFTVSAARIPDLNPLKVFKGQLTVLVISVLFILLSGQLDVNAMINLGVPGLLMVAGLVLVVRPLSVFLSIPPGELNWREKTLLALTAPRGIVAAAVASLSAIQLRETVSTDEGAMLESMVYLVIIATCTWATLMAGILPRVLGFVGDPSRRLVILVGANSLSSALGQRLMEAGWNVTMVDSSRKQLSNIKYLGFNKVRGDARDSSTYEQAGIERDSYLVSLTGNDELNMVVAELVNEEFDVEHPVIAVQQRSHEFGNLRRAWVDLLGGNEFDVVRWSRRLEDGRAQLRDIELDDEGALDHILIYQSEHPDSLHILCGWNANDRPIFEISEPEIQKLPRISVLAENETFEKLAERAEEEAPPAETED